jgi:hypothetical protein
MKFLECTKCHSKTEHRKITVTKEGCDDCHKNFSKIPDIIKYKAISFSHKLHAEKKNIECTGCHISMDFSKVRLKDEFVQVVIIRKKAIRLFKMPPCSK